MDERQTQITEGAGLQESRLNQEFIDWLNKWGARILMLLLLVAGAWAGWGWWERHQLSQRDQAFVAYRAALTAGSPDNLVSVAEEHEGRGQAANLARIAAADIYLAAVRQGVAPGGDPDNEADVLTDAQSAEMLGQARSLYQQVLERVEGDDALRELELSARNGLAAAALTNNEFEQGRTLMEEARQFAAASGFEQMAIWLEQRIANLDEVLDQPPLYPTEDIAAAWGPAPTDPALERGQGGAPGAGPLGPGPSPESIPMPDFGPLVPEPGLQEEPVGEGEAPPSPGPAPDGEGVGGGR